MNIHNLDGCAPVPLAHYLKALGILRLVAEQADQEARGWWEGDRFRLATELDREVLEEFFLRCYEPSALVSPWNRGAGFFSQNDSGLSPFDLSTAPRGYRVKVGIDAGRLFLGDLLIADDIVRRIKDETKITQEDRMQMREQLNFKEDKKFKPTKTQKEELKRRLSQRQKEKKDHGETDEFKKRLSEAERNFKRIKVELIPRIRQAWRGSHREWMDAAMVLGDDGNPHYPALLGTGGTDGHLDFTNNFFQRLNEIFDLSSPGGGPRPNARMWFRGAIWGDSVPACQAGSAVGQFLPGSAGGANSINGPSGPSLLNPADFILMMEGTVLFASHTARRLRNMDHSRVAVPFAVSSQGAGYFSASVSDEGARGEQWMPLWSQPLTLKELRRLLSEGRAQIGARSAHEPIDLARAVARLGTTRGIVAFQRFGYIERNGQSNLAVPLGRFFVPKKLFHNLVCLDDLDAWLGRLRRQARAKEAPARLQMAERRLSDALFAVTQHPEEPLRWQAMLLALADVEAVQRTGSGFKAGPVPRLRPEWVKAADDGSPELRLALACALQSHLDPIRRHWLPLDQHKRRFSTTGSASQARLDRRPDVVMEGRSGIEDAIAIIRRRLVEAAQSGEHTLSLWPAIKAPAYESDLARLLTGEVNLDVTMKLARALMALDRWKWRTSPCPPNAPAGDRTYPDDAWLIIRLCLLPYKILADDRRIPSDPAIVRRLESGDASSAAKLAIQRLRGAGIRTTVRVATTSPETSRLWAAALAFPVHKTSAVGFLHRLDPNSQKEKKS